jgi:diguanylate cyclase (GGDEF)-like protein
MIFATKAGRIYPYLHFVLLGACICYYIFGQIAPGSRALILISLISYGLLVLILGWLGRQKFMSLTNMFFAHSVLDGSIISLMIKFTGGFYSDLYLAFFPIVAMASVVLTGWRIYFGAAWYAIAFYLAVQPLGRQSPTLEDFLARLGTIWIVGSVAYAVAHSMRFSEAKLLKTLDVLNERTWELEKSQAQLSNIYETIRALSGILDRESLLSEILDIGNRIFHLQKCQIYLTNVTADCLYLYASLQNGNKRIFQRPPMHVRDISSLRDIGDRTAMMMQLNYNNRESGSDALDIPLVSRGKVMGIMRVITEKGTLPSEKERHLLIIFANSAAVAIDNSLLHKKTEELTTVDALTELFNYRHFRNKLSEELRRADRYRQRFSLLMLDLDHFKKVNDAHGHQTGNIVLRELSNVIKQCVRDVDIVARYGGEEFVIILPQTGDQDALVIAERIRSSIEKAYFSNSQGQRDIQITTSIGIASYPNGVRTMNQLLEKADQALYKAKSGGRNRVEMADNVKVPRADMVV